MNAFTRHTISLPAKWKLMYHVRWLSRVASVEMSLSALILLLIMTFSSNWVHVSTVVIYEPLLKYGLENINYTSEGFWDYCQIWTCYNESEKSRAFYIHEMSKICFLLSLGSSLLLTCWFHCVFVPVVKHLNVFDWSGGLASLFTACFIFFTIILFPIHLWIQELKTNKRTLLGWSYYIGWLVFLLYILCAILCFLNYKDSWRVCPQL
ncbi:outer dense fiber protein 4 isoform X1 [Monodelphis domestica]|uniref:Uncharacterized protein n=2 Tax=Monodelphis domestica TaxID=13616 RepID=A0A5F8HJ08_MONDO|nr:outer dense fiber protein 4 isoform X1 [Monodelphis domestica]